MHHNHMQLLHMISVIEMITVFVFNSEHLQLVLQPGLGTSRSLLVDPSSFLMFAPQLHPGF